MYSSEWQKNEAFMKAGDTWIFNVYKDDDICEGARDYWFGLSPYTSDCGEFDTAETEAFDVRDNRDKTFPYGKQMKETYVYDPQKSVQENLQRMEDLGAFDDISGTEWGYKEKSKEIPAGNAGTEKAVKYLSGKKLWAVEDKLLGNLPGEEWKIFTTIAEKNRVKTGTGHATQYQYPVSDVIEAAKAVIGYRVMKNCK